MAKDLTKFHSKDYIACLQKAEAQDEIDEHLEEFGIGVCLCIYNVIMGKTKVFNVL